MKISTKTIQYWAADVMRMLLVPGLAALLYLLISFFIALQFSFGADELFRVFFVAPFYSWYDFSEVVMKASILIIIALGLAVGFRASVWNIGAEGQFIVGAICGSIVALKLFYWPSIVLIPTMMLAAGVGGMCWAAIPALLKQRFHVNEILSSLMLVYIAQLLLQYVVFGPLQDPAGFNFPQSEYFKPAATYPYLIAGTRLSITPLIAAIALVGVYWLIKKTSLGFQLKVMSLSMRSMIYGGFNPGKIIWISFLLCGMLAGVAGVSEVSTHIHQLTPIISPGYGFVAIIVAFLAKLEPIGIVFFGFLMALIYIGAESAQIELGLPVAIASALQGLILFCFLSAEFLVRYRASYLSRRAE